MVYPMGGTIDGVTGDHILLAPSFIINEDHICQIVERLRVAIRAAIGHKKYQKQGGCVL